MTFVRVDQRNAHLASAVRLVSVQGRDGQPISKATLTAISNTRTGSGDNRAEEVTAILWTVWGRQAENAAKYLGKGSHVNVAGRMQNNNYERDGQTVYAMAFIVEEIDYLDSRTKSEALRSTQAPDSPGQTPESQPPAKAKTPRSAKGRNAPAPRTDTATDDDVPF